MGLPTSLIFIWPGTNATIPAHWARVTALDGLYPFLFSDSGDWAGEADGAATHVHGISKGVHTISAGPGSGTITPAYSGTKYPAATDGHTHGNSTSSNLPATNTGSVTNNPVHIDVIFIKPSDSTPVGVPVDAWSLFGGASLPSGWSLPTEPKDVLLRGAAASGNAYLTPSGSNAAHTHTGTHFHDMKASATGTGATANHYLTALAPAAARGLHTHLVGVDLEDPGMSSEESEPGWQKVAVIENNGATEDLPDATLALYLGLHADIPTNWAVYPMINDYAYLKGASDLTEIDDTGGDLDFLHAHTGNSHNHGGSTQVDAVILTCGHETTGAAVASEDHRHVWTVGYATDTMPSTNAIGYPPSIYAMLLKYTKPAGEISGAAAGTGAASGAVAASGVVVANAAGCASPSGTVAGEGGVAGSSAGLATAVITAIGGARVAGAVAGAALVAGSVLGTGRVAGSTAGSATATLTPVFPPLAVHFGIRPLRPGSTGARSASSVHHASRTVRVGSTGTRSAAPVHHASCACRSVDSMLRGSRRVF